MTLISVPKGRAGEYSPLALSVYSGGCDHGCGYCFCRKIQPGWNMTPRERDLRGLAGEAARARRQILLSFGGDPYGHYDAQARRTREALGVLRQAGCSVAVLTKGGRRCLRDLDLFAQWPEGRVKVGATLTFLDSAKSLEWEPGAALPEDRLSALRALKEAGIKTWASIEPVIDAEQSLAAIRASLPWVDTYAVGPLNHAPSAVDYRAFCVRAVETLRAAGRALYAKSDLRRFAPPGFLRPEECDPETMFLPDRPALAARGERNVPDQLVLL